MVQDVHIFWSEYTKTLNSGSKSSGTQLGKRAPPHPSTGAPVPLVNSDCLKVFMSQLGNDEKLENQNELEVDVSVYEV